MKEVIRIDKPVEEKIEPVEFTHYLDSDKGFVLKENIDYWKSMIEDSYQIVYLGRCDADGDLFAAYTEEYIRILKGHLNSGKY
jgi:hypothetical protein